MKTRRRFTAEFKAKVALEAMQGHGTITDLASRHELHPNLIMQWKRQAIEKLAKVFDDKAPEISGRPGCRDDEAARQDRRGAGRDRPVARLLQSAKTPLGVGRQNARRGLWYRNRPGEFGGVTTNPIHLSQPAKLSTITAPALRFVPGIWSGKGCAGDG